MKIQTYKSSRKHLFEIQQTQVALTEINCDHFRKGAKIQRKRSKNYIIGIFKSKSQLT